MAPYQSVSTLNMLDTSRYGLGRVGAGLRRLSSQCCAKGLMWQEVTGQRYWSVPVGRQPS